MKFKKYTGIILFFSAMFSVVTATYAWDGYDYEEGSYIEIDEGNLVRKGETIEIYDYNDCEYKDVEVEDIDRNGSTVDVEVYDSETGETRTFEMEDE